METLSSTDTIVQALTHAIVEHRLQPGSKLVEQALEIGRASCRERVSTIV